MSKDSIYIKAVIINDTEERVGSVRRPPKEDILTFYQTQDGV